MAKSCFQHSCCLHVKLFKIGLCHKGELVVIGGRPCLFNKATLGIVTHFFWIIIHLLTYHFKFYMLHKLCNVQYLTFYFVHSDVIYSINTIYVDISASTNCLVRKGYK